MAHFDRGRLEAFQSHHGARLTYLFEQSCKEVFPFCLQHRSRRQHMQINCEDLYCGASLKKPAGYGVQQVRFSYSGLRGRQVTFITKRCNIIEFWKRVL